MLTDAIAGLTELKHVALALTQFATAQFPDNEFQSSGKRWVARPKNFVTFEIHARRTQNIALSLRGYPTEFVHHPELRLKSGMAGYSECKVTNAKQLLAASSYIARAAELYRRGSSRTRKKPMVIE